MCLLKLLDIYFKKSIIIILNKSEMVMKIVYYALMIKENGNLVDFSVTSNEEGGAFASSLAYSLGNSGETLGKLKDFQNIWMVNSGEHAEWVRLNPSEWYSSEYDTPSHHFKPEELEIVEIVMEITAKPVSVKIPALSDLFQWLADKHNDAMKVKLIAINKLNPKGFEYSLGDLMEWVCGVLK